MSPLFKYLPKICANQELYGFYSTFSNGTSILSEQFGAISTGKTVGFTLAMTQDETTTSISITTICCGASVQIESSQVHTYKQPIQWDRIQINYLKSKNDMDSPEEPIAVDIWVVTNGHCVYVNYCVRGSMNNDATYEIITHQFTDA
jgi:hypothetical protein